MTKTWSLFELEKDTDRWKLVENLDSKVLSDIRSFSLVIKNKVLKGGRRYAVRLSAWHAGKQRGMTEHEFLTSTPPYGGTCSVTPDQGIALDTLFFIQCKNWTLENEPGTYKFAYRDVYTDLIDILYISTKENTTLTLPAGHPSKNSTLELVAVITDYDGLYTEVSLPVQVSMKYSTPFTVNELLTAINS